MSITFLAEHNVAMRIFLDLKLKQRISLFKITKFMPAVEVIVMQIIHRCLTKFLHIIFYVHPEYSIIFIGVIIKLFSNFWCPFFAAITPISIPFHASPRISHFNESRYLSFLI